MFLQICDGFVQGLFYSTKLAAGTWAPAIHSCRKGPDNTFKTGCYHARSRKRSNFREIGVHPPDKLLVPGDVDVLLDHRDEEGRLGPVQVVAPASVRDHSVFLESHSTR